MVLGEFFCILWLVKTMFLKFVEFWWKSIIHDKTILWIVFSPIIKMVNIVRNTQDGTNIQLFFYKQLRSGLSLKSCFYFQGFWGSKLLNGCFVVWPSNLCLRGIQFFQYSKSMLMISDFKIFPTMLLKQFDFGAFLV